MIKSQYNVLGVMSGTSLDGIDLAHVTFTKSSNWEFKINHAITVGYNDHWKAVLKNLVKYDIKELSEINESYTEYLALQINSYLKTHQDLPIDFIASHGHTALHKPDEHLTYQIGNLPVISNLTKHSVVCDFRVQDVQLGGQGAPLVPIGDQLLFSSFDFCINLGGFANISYDHNGQRLAFDICPVNIVLNHYSRRLGMEYDAEGRLARSGNIIHELLNQLNNHSYFLSRPPKSLGLEWVNENVIPLLESNQYSTIDILSTYVEHISIQLANNISNNSKVLITGGGAFNSYLIERLNNHKNANIIIPSNDIVNYKEAMIFGLLGVLKIRGENNCLSSVTGAKHDHSSGVIY